MKYYTKDQNENWFEAQNVADLQNSHHLEQKNLWSFVNRSIATIQPSDKALTYQMQSLVELMELLCPEQECQ